MVADEPPTPPSAGRRAGARGARLPELAGPADPAAVWAATGHLASTPYPAQLEAVRQARGFVQSSLEAIGLDGCADDAGLLVSELAANAVLHARTAFAIHLRPTLEGGVRVEVHDSSPLPPVHTTHSASAISGRGLDLVASMASRWGSHPVQDGKSVWFEVEASGAVPVVAADTEELLLMWSDQEDAPGATAVPAKPGIITSSLPAVEATIDVRIPPLPVAELLAAEEAMEDLLRELQLLLLATPAAGTPVPAAGLASHDAAHDTAHDTAHDARHDEELALAARLDAAARDFEQGRRQVREQASRAAAEGEQSVEVHLRLPRSARRAAVRYRDAVEDARELDRTGRLLTSLIGHEGHSRVRRDYLDQVIRHLPPEEDDDAPQR